MVEKLINDDVANALEQFFSGKVSIFEAGLDDDRPLEFLDRPFLSLLPDSSTYFVESLKSDAKGDGSYVVTADSPLKNGSLDTDASKFFQNVEERFNKIKPNQKLFVIDPDAIRTRYALDEASNRSLAKSLVEYIKEKKEKYDIEKNFPAAKETDLMEAAFTDTRPFSNSKNRNVTKDNLDGDFCVSLIVANNVDLLKAHQMFFIKGGEERLTNLGINNDALNRYILYHEFGHALDPANAKGLYRRIIDYNPQSTLRRHRTECFADVHSLLQMAREEKNTNVGEFIADVRISNTRTSINIKSKKGREELAPDILKKLEKMQKALPKPSKEDNAGRKLIELENHAEHLTTLKDIEASIAYYTTPSVDAAVAFAKQGLEDGSLLKMTDAEVLEAAGKIIDKTALSQDRINSLCMAVFKSDESNQDFKNIMIRADISDANMPISKEEIQKDWEEKKIKIKANKEKSWLTTLGIPFEKADKKESSVSIFMKKRLMDWKDTLIEKIAASGYTKEGIIKIVKEEKNEIRKHHGRTADEFGSAKIKILNEALLNHPDIYIAKARTRSTVRNNVSAVKAIKTTDLDMSRGIKIADNFMMMRKASADYAEVSINNALKADLTMLSPEEFLKAKNQELINYNKAMIAEKTAQKIAFAIYKNKPFFENIKKTVPTFASLVENAAKRRHPNWLEDYHLSFGSNDKKQLNNTLKNITGYLNIINKVRSVFAEKEKTPIATNDLVKNALNQKSK